MEEPAGRRVVIVGCCASGKSILAEGLKQRGIPARSFAQEHSVTPRVWRRREPAVLIYLYCSLASIRRRRGTHWTEKAYERQLALLADARSAAHLRIATDYSTPTALVQYVLCELQRLGMAPESVVDKETDAIV